jgi:replicative DNA helicase
VADRKRAVTSGDPEFSDRVLPAALDVERQVLKAVLVDPSDDGRVLAQVADLARWAFYDPRHKLIWGAITSLHADHLRPDLVSVRDRLKRDGEFEEAGGLSYVSELVDGSWFGTALLGQWVATLRERAGRRGLIRKLQALVDDAYRGKNADGETLGLDVLVSGTMTAANQVATMAMEEDAVVPFATLRDQAMADLEQELFGGQVGIPTGLQAIDSKLRGGGFMKGQLCYIGARPSRGKTSLLVQIAEHAVDPNIFGPDQAKRALFFSLEMPGREIMKRRLLSWASVDIQAVREWGNESQKALALSRLAQAAEQIQHRQFLLTTNAPRSIDRLRAECHREKARHGLDIVFIDYLGFVRGAKGTERKSLYEKVTENSTALHDLAVELDVPIVVGVQLNRDSAKKKGRTQHGIEPEATEPSLADFRDSGGIEQDADIAILIHQATTVNALETGPAELILAKQRNGWTGKVPVFFKGEFARFEDVEQIQQTTIGG